MGGEYGAACGARLKILSLAHTVRFSCCDQNAAMALSRVGVEHTLGKGGVECSIHSGGTRDQGFSRRFGLPAKHGLPPGYQGDQFGGLPNSGYLLRMTRSRVPPKV